MLKHELRDHATLSVEALSILKIWHILTFDLWGLYGKVTIDFLNLVNKMTISFYIGAAFIFIFNWLTFLDSCDP